MNKRIMHICVLLSLRWLILTCTHILYLKLLLFSITWNYTSLNYNFTSFLQWWCQILHVVLHYFLLTNYAWMLAEGFYLHTLLVFAFTSEDTLVRWSWTLAWSTPLVVISLYSILRMANEHTSEWVILWFIVYLLIFQIKLYSTFSPKKVNFFWNFRQVYIRIWFICDTSLEFLATLFLDLWLV